MKPSIGFSSALFPVEAERIFSSVASAFENGDKSELRNLVTEQYYSVLKRQLPERKRGSPKVVVATSGASIVQARRIQLTRFLHMNGFDPNSFLEEIYCTGGRRHRL